LIGKTVSHYKIISKLGEGGMGEVWEAHDSRLDRTVAIKLIPPRLSADPSARKRFVHEAKAASSIEHANICTIHEIDETPEGETFIVMPRYQGELLSDRIARGRVPLEDALHIVENVAGALAEAHDQDIIHRDVKPANIIIDPHGRPVLLDFGLAKLTEHTKVTKTGTTVGTLAYMAPEQAAGKEVDGRADLFSLGVVLYELVTGVRPFRGDHDAAVLYSIAHEPAPPLASHDSSLPAALQTIVDRSLAKEPNERYASLHDLKSAIADLRGQVHRASTSSQSEKATAPSRPRWMLPAVVVVVVLAALAVWKFLPRDTNENLTPARGGAPVTTSRTIGVIGFENLSDPEDNEHIGRMLMALIATDLTESGGLNVASTSKVLAAYKEVGGSVDSRFDPSLATEAAKRAGAATMLVGQVIRIGDKLLLTAELVDVETGNMLGSLKREAASSAELFALAGAMATDVRERLSVEVEVSAAQPFDLAQSLTDSPEAYRQFAAGELALHRREMADAVNRFRHAVTTDSTFALAWYRLAVSLAWRNDVEASLEAFASGTPYLVRLPKRWQIMYTTEYHYHQGKVDDAYEALTELISTTDMADAYYRLGEIATHFSRYYDLGKAKTCFERVLEIDPTFKLVFDHLFDNYLVLGERKSAEQLLDRYRTEEPFSQNVRGAEITILSYLQEYDEVIARLEENSPGYFSALSNALAYRGDFDRAFKMWDDATREEVGWYGLASRLAYRADFHYALGRFSDASADYEEASELLASQGQYAFYAEMLVVNNHLSRAYLLWLTDDVAGALDATREAMLSDRFDPRSYFWAGYFLLNSGKRPEADVMLHDLESMRAESFSPAGESYLHLLKAERHRVDGNLDDAVTELERASAGELSIYGRETRSLIWAGVLEARGDRVGAIAAYRDNLQNPWGCCRPPPIHGARWSIRRIPVLYELGRLLEEEGDLTAAREHYRAYLDRWGNADVAIPNVEKAGARLKAIGAP
jgi:serine/threonine protein kinase/tetratricopeptide (TPR) repeat protein